MKNLFLLFGLFIAFLMMPKDALACSCTYSGASVEAEINNEAAGAKAVFTGEVLEIRQTPNQLLAVKVKIQKSWKGAVSGEITVTTGQDGAACGVTFEVGKSYLIIGHHNDSGEFSAYICSSTREISSSAHTIKMLDNLNLKSVVRNANLTGKVYDQKGMAIKDALVRIKNANDKVYESVTDKAGVYKFNIPNGLYKIEVATKTYETFWLQAYRVIPLNKGQQVLDFGLTPKSNL